MGGEPERIDGVVVDARDVVREVRRFGPLPVPVFALLACVEGRGGGGVSAMGPGGKDDGRD